MTSIDRRIAQPIAADSPPTRRPNPPRALPCGLVLVLIAALIPALAGARQILTADAPSPATGHAEVIAQGVGAPPAAEIAWRVVADVAEAGNAAALEERALGFVLADRSPLLIDDDAGSQLRLAGGEAAFVAGGARQRRSSLTDADAPYYRLALVAAPDVADAGGDRLVFAGDPFAAPAGGNRDLDLVRDVLAVGETVALPETGSPTLLLATSGAIDVQAAGGLPLRLAAGRAASLVGSLSIAPAAARSATFVAAVIGPEVPPPPTPPTGSIALRVRGCPPGLSPVAAVEAAFDPGLLGECVAVPLAREPVLLLADNQALAPDSVDPAAAAYLWTNLFYGPFPVGELVLPAGYGAFLLVDAAGAIVASSDDAVAPGVANPGVIEVGPASPDVVATLLLFRSATGSIRLAPHACPPGMTAETLDGAACEPTAAAFDVALESAAGAPSLALADAARSDGGYDWSDLPFGTYTLRVTRSPSGYDGVAVAGADYDPGQEAFVLELPPGRPDHQVDLFFLQSPTAAGSLTVLVYDCPPGMGRDDLVADACRASTGFDLALSLPDGGRRGLADAVVDGNAVTWSGLPFGDHALRAAALPAPYTDGFAPALAPAALDPAAFLVSLSAAAPATEVAFYNLQPAEGPPPDADGDGLSDRNEAKVSGTDPNTPDTDGDGRADGDEIGPRRVVTDPLDPDSDDDGVDDGDEIVNGTDPNDPASA